MPFTPTPYTPPDFTLPHLVAAPDVTLVPAPKDFVAPEGYHAMSIYPEYLKIGGQWTLARDSRMDCVAVVEGDNVFVREFRHIRAGDLIACAKRILIRGRSGLPRSLLRGTWTPVRIWIAAPETFKAFGF